MAAFRNNDLPARPRRTIYSPWQEPPDVEEIEMPETKNDFRKALSGVVEARGREATRSIGRAREHLLLGSFTKRPN
jgi:hypothetical protein